MLPPDTPRTPEVAIPVTVITGFLGAGKTTLLNAWLEEYAQGEVAVIVNEWGAVGIDGELLGARARSVLEIEGGCVCCTTQLELSRALEALAARASPPARIFVETSGLASPAGVLRAILRGAAREALRVDGIVTVVSAARAHALEAHDVAAEQVGYADVLVLTHTDGRTAAELDAVRAALAIRNGAAIVASAARGRLSDTDGPTLDALLARRGAELRVFSDAPPAHDARIASVALVVEGELDEGRFLAWVEEALGDVEGRLLRMKGILAIAGLDVRMILQGVADHAEVDFGAPWEDAPRSSRLVVVGFGLDHEELAAGFAACAHAGCNASGSVVVRRA
ncbi:MAG: GTP-binding protein [Sandaracinaceae bacterium]|nr:GTP-binding protein [Sandaracinaceae bacterium]